ncbi:hypothetical protein F5B22DRAFT_46061 [Xylaria bambusicola]|uniref:uncharacterized protein n=1 Tax=Xylaria bambusicola TaxID=326684 RepID=UPI002007F54B|nr:uncharacterized protein F5B22DRAFT_46061 [Xylaria bambusicola]KAI0502798.1 hypothetical protein F5B22DRAFT_46061 [Xylaria bambusicola]
MSKTYKYRFAFLGTLRRCKPRALLLNMDDHEHSIFNILYVLITTISFTRAGINIAREILLGIVLVRVRMLPIGTTVYFIVFGTLALVLCDELSVCLRCHDSRVDPFRGRRLWFYPFLYLAVDTLAIVFSVFTVTKDYGSSDLVVYSAVSLALSVLDVGISLGCRFIFPSDSGERNFNEIMSPIILQIADFDNENDEDTPILSLWKRQHGWTSDVTAMRPPVYRAINTVCSNHHRNTRDCTSLPDTSNLSYVLYTSRLYIANISLSRN